MPIIKYNFWKVGLNMKKAVFVFFGVFISFYVNAQVNVDNVLHSISIYCKNYDLVSGVQGKLSTGSGSEFDYDKYLNNDINAIDNLISPDLFGLFFGCNSLDDAMGLMNNMGNYFKKINLTETIISQENISVHDTSLVEYQQYKYILHVTITPIKIVMVITQVNNIVENIIAVGYR